MQGKLPYKYVHSARNRPTESMLAFTRITYHANGDTGKWVPVGYPTGYCCETHGNHEGNHILPGDRRLTVTSFATHCGYRCWVYTGTNIGNRAGGGGHINDSKIMKEDHDHDFARQINSGGPEPDLTQSTTGNPTPTAIPDVNRSPSIPKRVLTVGDKLKEPLVSSTSKPTVWTTAEQGTIIFGKTTANSSNGPGSQKLGRVCLSIWVAADASRPKSVPRAKL